MSNIMNEVNAQRLVHFLKHVDGMKFDLTIFPRKGNPDVLTCLLTPFAIYTDMCE